MLLTANFNFMFRVLLRWMEMNKWKLALSILFVVVSIILETEPAWMFSALDALRIPYVIFLTACVLFFFIRRNNLLASGTMIALLILIPGIWKFFRPAVQAPPLPVSREIAVTQKADFTVAHFNVKEHNKHILTVAEAAIRSGADIVSFQELHAESLHETDSAMHTVYPYELSDVSIPGFGMAVYSKYPISNRKIEKTKDFPVLTGVVTLPGGHTVHFVSATTSTPTNAKDYDVQLAQFRILADYADHIDSPMVVMGDMNAVPWSDQIEDFIRTTHLKDSRKDLAATFPAQSPLMRIPIDYIFYSDRIRCLDFSTLGGTTSNHLGILGSYIFEGPAEKQEPVDSKNLVD